MKLPTSHESMLPKFLKGASQSVEQSMRSNSDLVGEIPSSKTNTGTGG